MSHNSRLKQTLKQGLADCLASTRKQQLVEIVDTVTAVGPVKFEQALPLSFAILAGVIALLLGVHGLSLRHGSGPWYLGAGIAVIAAIVTAFALRGQRSLISNLVETLYGRALAIDCNIREGQALNLNGLQEFGRGNHSNQIHDRLDCDYEGRTFQVFRYHYVDRREVDDSYTDSEGRRHHRTKTEYDHYDRYGAVVVFPHTVGIRVGTDNPGYGGPRWKAESRDFNEAFRAHFDDELQAARFFKPVMQLKLLEATGMIPKLCLEFCGGRLCMTSTAGPLLQSGGACQFDQPEQLKQELAALRIPRSLLPFAWLADEMERLSQDHFDEDEAQALSA